MIFDKIKECDLFIADVSIVNKYTAVVDDMQDGPAETVSDATEPGSFDGTKANPKDIDVESSDKPKMKIRYSPNPNVLEELGFAAAIVGWNYVICLMNTDYGDEDDLPFDLKHHRIFKFSTKDKSRSEVVKELRDVVSSHIMDLVENGIRPKDGHADHVVGYYDASNHVVIEKLVTMNLCEHPFVEHYQDEHKNEIRNLVEIIRGIDIIPGKLPEENKSKPDLSI